jgi:hypothetical protein
VPMMHLEVLLEGKLECVVWVGRLSVRASWVPLATLLRNMLSRADRTEINQVIGGEVGHVEQWVAESASGNQELRASSPPRGRRIRYDLGLGLRSRCRARSLNRAGVPIRWSLATVLDHWGVLDTPWVPCWTQLNRATETSYDLPVQWSRVLEKHKAIYSIVFLTTN